MDAILTRAGDMPVVTMPRPRVGDMPGRLRQLLARLANAAAQRVELPQRELSPEWFRFPLP